MCFSTYINKSGGWVVKPKFNEAGSFHEGRVGVKVDGKWGYINKNGDWVVKPKFDDAYGFYGGRAKVKIDGILALINKEGWMIPIEREKSPISAFSGSSSPSSSLKQWQACNHVYVGKVFEGQALFFKNQYEVVGFSNRTGKATITLPSDRSFRQEINCSQIPE